MIQKKIAIVGRARTGKSFLVSMFSKDAYQYRRLFCEEGSDKTACPVHNYFYKNETKMKSRIIFYSNFESLYNKNTDEEVKAILEEWKALREISGIREEEEHEPEENSLSIDPDEDGANESLNRIENLIRRMNQYENDKNLTRSEQYFEVHLKAGELCDSLFDKETDVLEVIDVSEVSGDTKFRLMKAGLYIFVLNQSDNRETETMKEIIKELKVYLSGAKVCFLYKKEVNPNNEEEYDADTLKIQESMKEFEQYFEDLRGSIISSSIEALYPASHSLLYPIMKAEQSSKAEEIFRKRLEDKIKRAFSEDLRYQFQEIKDRVSDIADAKDFIIKTISHIPSYELDESRKVYTLHDFSKEKHGRTKTADEGRLLGKMYAACRREKEHIYNYFEQFSVEDCTEWQAEIIKNLFIIIGRYIDMDNGSFDSNHRKEKYPQTMWIEEGILSAEIIENYNQGKIVDEQFGELFASFGIKGSWSYVSKTARDEMYEKLKLVKEVLVDRPVYSLEEMVLYRYIMGFRVLAIHRILTEIGLSKEESIALLKELSY